MTDKANSLIQELVDKCNRLWRGEKIDFNADKAYNLIERIYEEIKEVKPTAETLAHRSENE